MVAEHFARVLDLSPEFATQGNDAMFERQELLKDAENEIATWLVDEGPFSVSLKVKSGGRQSQFAPVPWLRIYSPLHSPRTTQGFYLVYLFAADGHAFFLSLNQGTSEFRSGKQRPILDKHRVAGLSAQARERLKAWGSDLHSDAITEIDLRPSTQDVGRESIRRALNYEVGNVYGLRYPGNDIPRDDQLESDLLAFMPLLEEIYRDPVEPGDSSVRVAQKSGSGHRRLADAAIRRACEYRGMDVVEDHYSLQGWQVERVHLQYLGYDLRCTRSGVEIHVEVKGSTVGASQVELTANEVAHAREYEGAVLAVVDRIAIDTDNDDPVGVGGNLTLYEPWQLAESSLSATRFIYRL